MDTCSQIVREVRTFFHIWDVWLGVRYFVFTDKEQMFLQ